MEMITVIVKVVNGSGRSRKHLICYSYGTNNRDPTLDSYLSLCENVLKRSSCFTVSKPLYNVLKWKVLSVLLTSFFICTH